MRSIWRFIAWPALLTLGVTLLRLFAELNSLAPALANRDGGGPMALIGIVWLVFVFGAWFGWRLAQSGRGPGRPGRVVLVHVLAIGGAAAAAAIGLRFVAFPEIVLVNGASYAVAAAVAWRAWPEMARLNLAYGIAARIPVVIVTLIAVPMAWGTHYEKIGFGDGIELAAAPRMLWLCGAQIVVWLPFTVLFGGLSGGIAAVIAARGRTGLSSAAAAAHD
ncbi:MAG: hypothetical protein AAF628_08595 [Planctomycetota bacterium]